MTCGVLEFFDLHNVILRPFSFIIESMIFILIEGPNWLSQGMIQRPKAMSQKSNDPHVYS